MKCTTVEDLNRSIFIGLPKKPGGNECEHHRTISLMIHIKFYPNSESQPNQILNRIGTVWVRQRD